MAFLDNLSWRYATKKYSGRAVSDADLEKILEAIHMAPSAIGAQPYHIIVASDEMKNKLIENSGQTDKLGASHLLIFCTRVDYPAREEKQVQIAAELEHTTPEALSAFAAMLKRATEKPPEVLRAWAARQAYLALGFALAAAAELSVDSSPMEGFKPDEFKKILELPEYMDPVVIMALGYRDPEDHAQPTKRAKVRFPKDDLFEFR